MKVKINDIINSFNALRTFMTKEHAGSVSYKLMILSKSAQDHYNTFMETRNKRIKELGKENKKDQTWAVKKENEGKYQDEMEKLMDAEVEIEGELIPFEEIECKMSAIDLQVLEWIFEFPKK